MPRPRKSWSEKMQAKPPHGVVLEKDFAGVRAGSKLHISSPEAIARELQQIPPGTTVSLQQFRRQIAAKERCDATCPVSTSLFLRIVAEYGWEQYQHSGNLEQVAPFWRVIDSKSPLGRKLSFDPAWIDLQRELEAREGHGGH